MEELHYPLSVLSRCISYKNISGAAQNIGLSQPQISRIVKKLESELGLVLIDKSSPRHSRWTKEAFNLVEIYVRNTRSLESSLNQLREQGLPQTISIGVLEGLIPEAIKLMEYLNKNFSFKEIYIDVYDQNQMESLYQLGELDLIFTFRPPSKTKPIYLKIIGYQNFKQYRDKGIEVLSPFEYRQKKTTQTKKLISNSLRVRRLWLESHGGKGQLPGDVKMNKSQGDQEIMLIAKDTLNPNIWRAIG